MLIDIKPLIHFPGKKIDFNYEADFSEYSINQQKPFRTPVRIEGAVTNENDVLYLSGQMKCILHWTCDRCMDEFDRESTLSLRLILVEQNEENDDDDDMIVLNSPQVDLDEIFLSQLVLETPYRILCKDDCKGLCDGCGKNLNYETCICKKEIDPRLAPLMNLLKKD